MKVLFVCSGNACRSPVAEALLRTLKSEIEVDSAGTHAYYKITNSARNYLRQQKAEQYLKNLPESLEDKKLNEYDLIVAMETKHKEIILRKCPECANKVIVWHITDPYNLPTKHAEKIFNLILLKTKELADSM